MWRCVDLVWTDVSEERIASIFRVEKSASEEPARSGGCRQSAGTIFRYVMTCSQVVHLRFGGTYFFHLQCRWVSQANNLQEASGKQRMETEHFSENLVSYTRLNGITSQKIVLIITAVRTSYLIIKKVKKINLSLYLINCRSQFPRGLRHKLSSLARTLESWVRILLKTWMSVCAYILYLCCPMCR
jgi:hypothetical protein